MTSQLQLDAMLEYERAKTAFATNQFSGPMNPTIASGASFMPPGAMPGLRAPLVKKAARFKLEGDAVIEVGKDGKSLGKGDVLEKRALIERLVRLGATPVPGTPKGLMKLRSPAELEALQHGVTSAIGSITDPIKERVGGLIEKHIPHEGAQRALRAGAHLLIDNPETIPMQALPIPGLTPGWIAAKRGAERAIDHFAPLESALPSSAASSTSGSIAKMAAGAPTRGGFMMASDIPPMTAPSLRAPIVKQGEGVKAAEAARVVVQEASAALHKVGEILTKVGDSLPDYVTYNPGDFKPAKLNERPKLSAGQNESIDENAKDSLPEDYKKTAAQVDSQYGADTGADVSSENYLRGKEKDGDVSPSRTWSGGTGGMQRQESFIPPFRSASLRSMITKQADSTASPFQAAQTAKTVGTFKPGKIPGPSIADIAKPKGAGFGTGIAGAFKSTTGIGGTGPVSLSASPGSLK